jgi:hypothetical protein
MSPVEYILPLCTFAGTLTVLAIGFIHNNSRISDLRSDLGNRIDLLKELMDAKLARQEEVLLSKFAELDNRLTRIESHLNLH